MGTPLGTPGAGRVGPSPVTRGSGCRQGHAVFRIHGHELNRGGATPMLAARLTGSERTQHEGPWWSVRRAPGRRSCLGLPRGDPPCRARRGDPQARTGLSLRHAHERGPPHLRVRSAMNGGSRPLGSPPTRCVPPRMRAGVHMTRHRERSLLGYPSHRARRLRSDSLADLEEAVVLSPVSSRLGRSHGRHLWDWDPEVCQIAEEPWVCCARQQSPLLMRVLH